MYIKINVMASSRKQSIKKISETHFEISIREPAKQNMANRQIMEIMRKQFAPRSIIKIVSGHHSASKIISVETKVTNV